VYKRQIPAKSQTSDQNASRFSIDQRCRSSKLESGPDPAFSASLMKCVMGAARTASGDGVQSGLVAVIKVSR
jgi:hypothetical protein